MNYTAVLDASTLILLAKTDLLQVLLEKTGILIPAEVRSEATAGQESVDAKLITKLIQDGKIRVLDVSRSGHRRQIESDFGLDPGEAAALELAKEKAVPVGTDDGPAIKAAKIVGVPFFTAIHVLIALCEKGRIRRNEALAKLDKLEKIGRYSVRILEDAREKLRKAR
ncbi:hypothetical protein HY522_09160 [bacterium]|nr:hypothetical protein [bacterium]